MTIIETYESIYGTRAKILLRTLGGDPNAIIADTAAKIAEPNPLADMLGLAPSTDAEVAEQAHYAILHAIKSAYFGKIDRNAAVAVVTALSLSETAKLTVFDDMEYNYSAFASEWASAHPDEERITLVDSDWLP